MLYVSVFGAERMNAEIVRQKERFVRELEAAEISALIVRPTGFFSDMRELLTMAEAGTVWLFGDGQLESNPIDGDDLAEACAKALGDETCHELCIGGPDVLTHEQAAQLAIDARKRAGETDAMRIRYVPAGLARALMRAATWVTPERVHGPAEFFVQALTTPMVAPAHGHRRLADFFDQCLSDEPNPSSPHVTSQVTQLR